MVSLRVTICLFVAAAAGCLAAPKELPPQDRADDGGDASLIDVGVDGSPDSAGDGGLATVVEARIALSEDELESGARFAISRVALAELGLQPGDGMTAEACDPIGESCTPVEWWGTAEDSQIWLKTIGSQRLFRLVGDGGSPVAEADFWDDYYQRIAFDDSHIGALAEEPQFRVVDRVMEEELAFEYVPGIFGSAAVATSGVIESMEAAVFGQSVWVEFWFRADSYTTGSIIAQLGECAGWSIHVTSPPNLEMRVNSGVPGLCWDFSDSEGLSPSPGWQRVGMWMERGAAEFTVCLNEVCTDSANDTAEANWSGFILQFGSWNPASQFLGDFDEVRIATAPPPASRFILETRLARPDSVTVERVR